MQQSNESCCNVALVKFLAEFLRTTPTAAQDDCVFPLDTFSLYKHYFVLTQHELGEGCNAYLKRKSYTSFKSAIWCHQQRREKGLQ